MQTLAEFIKECVTIAEASRRLGVSQQTLHRWKKGKKVSKVQAELAKQKGVDLLAVLEPKPAQP